MPRLTLSTRNTSAIAARFFAADRTIQREARKVVRAHGEAVHGLARENMLALRIFDQGWMYDRLRLVYGSDGLSFEVGWRERDFVGKMRRDSRTGQLRRVTDFYPIYVLFGTRFMPARDPLFPAHARVRPFFRAALADVLRDAVQRRNG